MTAFWTATFLVVGVLALGGLYVYAWSEPTWQVFGPALVRGPAAGGRVALTFDDGPASPFTEQVLDILRSCKVKATFFVCGRNVERHPDLLKRIHAEGHLVGNHTYSHPFPYFRSKPFFREEIDRTQEAIEKVIGRRPTIFRPPYGARWRGLYDVLDERGLRLVNWSDTGYDWKCEAEEIVRKTLEKLGPGSIILLHDGKRADPPGKFDRSGTVLALPAILDGVQKAGLTFVPLSEFLLET
jgi:peptidoglycan/xylan/chitin deacetylase (PgdA/CDA1 family)